LLIPSISSLNQSPLSGSLEEGYFRIGTGRFYTFQLPLSGSRSTRSRLWQPHRLSTPSLGITAGSFFWLNITGQFTFQLPLSGSLETGLRFGEAYALRSFNSLSRDHTVRTLDELHIIAVFTRLLSTPSLGITEPDSGIFRLSAAFCRGASSHK
jgi:hypothetical protein